MRRTIAFLLLVIGTGCGSDDDSQESAESDFIARCNAAYAISCDKGFACDSVHYKGRFNSADHCKHEMSKSVQESSKKFSTAALKDCADTCDLMKNDIQSATCEELDRMVFNDYSCGP